MKKFTVAIWFVALTAGAFAQVDQVAAPPRELVEAWKLSPVYTKHVSVGGLPVLASAKVSDFAVAEAAFLIRKMVGHRPEILRAMADNRVRFVVMATSEMTTDVPEHSDLTPKSYWDRRARGLGATPARPAVSCGEENLLDLPGDPYAKENILIHEFAHAIHERGLNKVDPTFDQRLAAAYEHAKAAGLWRGTYAMQNRMEYWAEAAQSWFDCNRVNDTEHGPIDTRDKLKPYDPEVAKLLTEVFGDGPWHYMKPSQRPAAERAHLAGFVVAKAGRFAWPKETTSLDTQGTLLAWLEPGRAPSASPRGGGQATTVNFVNRGARPVSIEWLDFDGRRKHFADVRPGLTHLQSTYAGHVWIVAERENILGTVIAGETEGRVEIKSALAASAELPEANDRETRTVAGWTVHISKALLATNGAATARALELLGRQLKEIIRVVPKAAVAELQKVPLYFSPTYPGKRGGAEFHPDAKWLRDNGRDPIMAKGVEFSGIPNFEKEMNRMPNFALHELAHAYHNRVIRGSFGNAEIKAAYEHAKASGKYDRVERWHGNGRPNTFERAYAMTNPMEYFAENSEAFFSRNDFFPFTRDELKLHDPEMFAVLKKAWGVAGEQ
ncbi:MAG TPA: hypothetical protein VI454_04675 [Verrucomicrobiae bacterium]|jgi:hypothetical protein